MKKLLIVYNNMTTGGSTTSLLSILNLLDYQHYHVDLILKQHQGDLIDQVPESVNLLPPALPNPAILKFKKLTSPLSLYDYLKIRLKGRLYNANQTLQVADRDYARLSIKLNQEYDVAISFLEFWPTYYMANYVKARRKIAWIHVDYIGAGFDARMDSPSFEKIDQIVVVAKSCLDSFIKIFPRFQSRTSCIENILSAPVIRALANEPVDFEVDPKCLNIATVCRIVFSHKGLDRGVDAFRRLKEEHIGSEVKWFIIGDGPDYSRLEASIQQYGLENNIFLLGNQKNPYKYLKHCDLFFLPSRYEGKPMAVTEAMMLGVPPLVAEYTSAREQIEDGMDGLIANNDDDSIYEALKQVIQNRSLIDKLRQNIAQHEYSNLHEFKKVEDVIEGYDWSDR